MKRTMWNITNELMKREQGLLKQSFTSDCYSSKFVLDSLEISYVQGWGDRIIKFNQKGDLFGFLGDCHFNLWDTLQREQKSGFRITEMMSDFKFLNNFNDQNDIKVATSSLRAIEFHQLTPGGSWQKKGSVSIPSNEWIELALCPNSDVQMFFTDRKDRIYQIDLRAGAAIVANKQYENFRIHNLNHDPIKSELCTIGSDKYVRIFDTRNLNKPLKEYEVKTQATRTYDKFLDVCSYNFDGSEILVTDQLGDLFLVFNDNSGKTSIKYEGRYDGFYAPQFFGPKSEYFVYLRENGLIFNDKQNTKDIAVKVVELNSKLLNSTLGNPAMHPNKPIVIADIDGHLMFCAPKGTYDGSRFYKDIYDDYEDIYGDYEDIDDDYEDIDDDYEDYGDFDDDYGDFDDDYGDIVDNYEDIFNDYRTFLGL